MEISKNLFVRTQGAKVRVKNSAFVVDSRGEQKFRAPPHLLEGILCFGNVSVTPAAIHLCTSEGVTLSYFSYYGRFRGSFMGPTTGNVLLRRDQFRRLEDTRARIEIARRLVAGKLKNCRQILLRSARDAEEDRSGENLRRLAEALKSRLQSLRGVDSLEKIRGVEGQGAKEYFSGIKYMLLDDSLSFWRRTRRPPEDPINATLSFLYGIIRHDCVSALSGVGLDPQVGYLHTLRPGRPALALDLMEELRPVFADRLCITLFNRKQLQPSKDFESQTGGAIHLKDGAVKTILDSLQELRERKTAHRFLERQVHYGDVPHLQARLMARRIRGQIDNYPPFLYQ